MKVIFVAILGGVVLTAFVVGGRLLWRYFYPIDDVGAEKKLPIRWPTVWNGRLFAVMVVLMFLAIGVYRMTTIQEPPANLERPASRTALEKVPTPHTSVPK
ncbi:MAG: hypothetical protein H7829_08160 [Magnetococcus sp. THC-1_WYH]